MFHLEFWPHNVTVICSMCKEREARKGQRSCPACHSAAQIKYREHADRKRERAAHFRGFEEGVAACVRYMREHIGERAWTGHQTARMVEKAMLSAESPEVIQRRALVASFSGKV